MNPKNQLTILCPIKDRPEFTQRFVDYSVNSECQFRIIVADGSRSDEAREIVNNASAYNKNIEYVKHPADDNWDVYMQKICDSLDTIKTEYTVLACDDDFIDYKSLEFGVEFLSNNKEYSAFASEVIDFDIYGTVDSVYGKLIITNESRDCGGRYSTNQMVDDDDTIKRLNRFSDIWPYEYIHKTETLKHVYQLSRQLKIKNYYHLLIIMRYMTLMSGKVYYCNEKSILLRQLNTPSSEGSKLLTKINFTELHFLADKENFYKQQCITKEILNLFCEDNERIKCMEMELMIYKNLAQEYQIKIERSLGRINKLPKLSSKLKVLLRKKKKKMKILGFFRKLRVVIILRERKDISNSIKSIDNNFLADVKNSVRDLG